MGSLVSIVVEASSCLACSCLMWIFDATLAQVSRLGHFLIIVVTFGFASILGNEYSSQVVTYKSFLGDVKLGNTCNSNHLNKCIYQQLIYRASLSLFSLFLLTTSFAYFTEYINKRFWIMKFTFALGLFVALWWVDDTTFVGWSNFARVVSFLWLLVQGLLALDFSHDIHDLIMRKADDAETNGNSGRIWYAIYLFTSLSILALGITGLGFLFRDNFGCQLNQFFIVWTLLSGVVTIPISLLNCVNKGLLTPCIIFTYSVFLCWYAILSSADTTCNSSTSTSIQTNTINAALVVTLIISTSVLLYCIFFGTALLNLFNTQTEYSVLSSPLISDQADSSSTGSQSRLTGIERVRNDGNYGTSADTDEGRGGGRSSSNNNNKYENVFFHTLMMLFACYGAMVLTSWDTTDSPITSTATTNTAVSTESMWLKIVSQWVFLLTYYRTMQLAYYENS